MLIHFKEIAMNKTVLITGSSKGIGKAIAIKFAKEGFNIAINSNKSKNELEETKEQLISYNIPVFSMQGM